MGNPIKSSDIIDKQNITKDIASVIESFDKLLASLAEMRGEYKKGETTQKKANELKKKEAKITEASTKANKKLTQEFKDAMKATEKRAAAAKKAATSESKARQKVIDKIAKERQKRLELILASRKEIKTDADLNAKLNAQRKLRGQLSQSTAKGAKQYNRMTVSIQRLAASQDKANKSMKVFGHNVGNYPQQAGKATGATSKFSAGMAGMAVAIGAGIMAVRQLSRYVKDIVQVFAEFDQTQAKLGVISGATTAQMDKMRSSAKEIGATTEKSAQQVSQLQLNLAKLGFTPEEIDKATASIVGLSIATGEDLAESATTVAGILNAFNLDASESARVADVMASSFSNSALDLQKFKDGMSKFAPVAQQLNWSIEETTGWLGVLADNNIDAGTASAQLRNIMLELNAKGLDLDTVLAGLNGSTNLLADATELFGKRAAPIAAVMAENVNKAGELTTTFEGATGAAVAMADTMADTLFGDMKKAESSIEGLKISIGEGGNDGIRGIIQGFTKAIDSLTKSGFVIKYLDIFRGQFEMMWDPIKDIIDVIKEIGVSLGLVSEDTNSFIFVLDAWIFVMKVLQVPLQLVWKTIGFITKSIKFLVGLITGKNGIDQAFRMFKQSILDAISPITDLLVDLGIMKESVDSAADGFSTMNTTLDDYKTKAMAAAGVTQKLIGVQKNLNDSVQDNRDLRAMQVELLEAEAEAAKAANKAYQDFLDSLKAIDDEYKLQIALHNTEKGQLDALLVKNKAIFDAYKNHYANGGYTQDEIVRLEVMLNNIRLVEEEVARYNELLIEQKKTTEEISNLSIKPDDEKIGITPQEDIPDELAEELDLVLTLKQEIIKLFQSGGASDELLEKFAKLTNVLKSVQMVAGAVGDAFGASFDRQVEGLQIVEDKNNEYYDQLIENNENSTLSDEQKASATLQLEAAKQAAAEETQRKAMELKRKKAIVDKAQALFDIAIATAIGIMGALGSLTPNPILAAAIGIAGAAQAVIVATKPLPQYKMGLKNAQTDHEGMVADAGREIVNYPDGTKVLYESPTIIDIPTGTSILPNSKTEAELRTMQFNSDLSLLNQTGNRQLKYMEEIARNTRQSNQVQTEVDLYYLKHYVK